MVRLRDLVQHVIANATDANLQRRAKLSIHDIDEDKLDAEARLFYLFEEACGQKKELQNALQLDSKFVSFILNECCVRQNKHKWAYIRITPDFEETWRRTQTIIRKTSS
jgi:hypothetical protein